VGGGGYNLMARTMYPPAPFQLAHAGLWNKNGNIKAHFPSLPKGV